VRAGQLLDRPPEEETLSSDLLGMMHRPGWWALARCRAMGAGLSVFFPITSGGAAGQEAERRAKAICRDCPVRRPCLETAEQGDLTGIFGGTTTQERRRARRP
jgi:WhiB family transcriptional regulator, redox-sensing transcriptional regulator